MPSKFHNLSNEALADEIGRVDAILRAAEAELKALKDEFKRRGLDSVEGETSTVTASETFQNRLDTARVREFLGDHVKQFETLMVSTVIRIKPTRRLAVLAVAQSCGQGEKQHDWRASPSRPRPYRPHDGAALLDRPGAEAAA